MKDTNISHTNLGYRRWKNNTKKNVPKLMPTIILTNNNKPGVNSLKPF